MPRAYQTSPWLKRVLIPFWVVRLLLMVLVVAVFGLALGLLANHKHTSASDSHHDSDGVAYDDLDELSGSEIRKATALKPRTFLIFNVLQTTVWLVILVLDIVVATKSSAFGGLFTIVEFLVFLGLLIYAAVVYHRERKQGRGSYTPALSPEHAEPLSYASAPQLYHEAYAPHEGTGYRENDNPGWTVTLQSRAEAHFALGQRNTTYDTIDYSMKGRRLFLSGSIFMPIEILRGTESMQDLRR
ncbi:hypothetical protein K490DRAFT_53072 [Saccharata proteae CBS 121410]|uniref:Uncharacterized protein n=1 Tax=Saccharata proteae CBS 121410 TaxID=1314787 RepID=A0A9P4LZY3_9PEZI|nr:hypothetical protein K490DRAFT_53072 [Saccharata proteae CBS 121410]